MIIKSLQHFYSDTNNINLFLSFLKSESQISIRLIDYYVTKYSKNNKISYKIFENNTEQSFNVHTSYKQQLKAYQKKHKTFSKENLYYNQEEDYYVCPIGQKMHKTHQSQKNTEAGYEQNLSHYQAQNCQGCPLRSQCFKAKGNRSIERNHNLERHKQKTRELLLSEIGIQKRKQRSADVEPVFAQLKHNNGFRRFTLKGIKKVDLEF